MSARRAVLRWLLPAAAALVAGCAAGPAPVPPEPAAILKVENASEFRALVFYDRMSLQNFLGSVDAADTGYLPIPHNGTMAVTVRFLLDDTYEDCLYKRPTCRVAGTRQTVFSARPGELVALRIGGDLSLRVLVDHEEPPD